MVKAIDTSRLQEKIRKTQALFEEHHRREISLAEDTRESVSGVTPKVTGLTAGSWASHILTDTINRVSWIVRNYGREQIVVWLEFGTKSHVIVPKKPGGVLAFFWEKLGKDVFLRRVYHPGTKPLGFVRMSRDLLGRRVMEINNVLKGSLRSIWR